MQHCAKIYGGLQAYITNTYFVKGIPMKHPSKDDIETMYKKENQRSIELVFYNQGIKKSIGIRKTTPEFMKECDDIQDSSASNNNDEK